MLLWHTTTALPGEVYYDENSSNLSRNSLFSHNVRQRQCQSETLGKNENTIPLARACTEMLPNAQAAETNLTMKQGMVLREGRLDTYR